MCLFQILVNRKRKPTTSTSFPGLFLKNSKGKALGTKLQLPDYDKLVITIKILLKGSSMKIDSD